MPRRTRSSLAASKVRRRLRHRIDLQLAGRSEAGAARAVSERRLSVSEQATDRHAGYDTSKLFILSVLALTTAGMTFSIRGASVTAMQAHFFDVSNAATAGALITGAMSAAFIGGAAATFIGSPLCDSLGMGRLLLLASLCHIGGTLGIIFAPVGTSAYTIHWIGMVTAGLAGGQVEAVINPLIATIYPEDKTHKLNVLHAWWPGGIIIGGLLSFAMGKIGMSWQAQRATIIVPAVGYALMTLGTKFPPTERVAAGVSGQEMLKQVTHPLYIVLFFSMFLTAAAELAPNQWVDAALSDRVGMKGILLVVYVAALMFVMRHFAGSLAHRLSPIGLMWVSCLLASIGLYTLSIANSPITGLLAATVWGVGVCYMWPTMLGITSERFPRGGAFLIGLTGSAGGLSIYFVLPAIGRIFDNAKAAAANAAGYTFDALQKAAETSPAAKATLEQVKSQAYGYSFRVVAILPAILLIVFGAWWLYDKSQGGYRAERLETDFDRAIVESGDTAPVA
jgi:MFS family permease